MLTSSLVLALWHGLVVTTCVGHHCTDEAQKAEFESFAPLTAAVVLSFNVIIFNLKLKFQTSPLNASDEGELILSNKAL